MTSDFSTYLAETPRGDTYGRGVGSAVLPDGSVLAVAQYDDETARALIAAWWAEWLEVLG